jgi:hypothetical protein
MTRKTKQPKKKISSMKQKTIKGRSSSTALIVRPKASSTMMAGRQQLTGKQRLPGFVVAQIDPFCPEAFGCKVPDDATAPSAVAFFS